MLSKRDRRADQELRDFVRGRDGRLRYGVLVYALAVLLGSLLGAAWAAGMGDSGPDYGVQAANRMGEVFASKLDDDRVTGSVALSNVEADYTLPETTEGTIMYTMVCAYGNDAYLRCGAAPVAATTAAGGYTFRVADGQCLGPLRLTGPVCSHIATAAVGHIVFMHFDQSQ